MKIVKRYRKAFVAETSKLTRLMSVIGEKMTAIALPVRQRFEAHLLTGKTFETESLDHIFQLDNSRRNRITRLVVNVTAIEINPKREYFVAVDFDGRSPADVTLTVQSTDARWATETVSLLEEQVERTFQPGLMHKLSGLNRFSMFLLPVPVFSALAPLIGLSIRRSARSETMWLSAEDLSSLQNVIQKNQNLSSEQQAEILTRQVRNLIAEQNSSALPAVFHDWRMLFVAVPILVAAGAFAYLVSRCYPFAVFSWGDADEWYQGLVSRRKTIWSMLIGSLFIGIIANLFVFGISIFVHP